MEKAKLKNFQMKDNFPDNPRIASIQSTSDVLHARVDARGRANAKGRRSGRAVKVFHLYA